MGKIGFYGGSFNPLHLAHVNCIIEASNICEKLYIILFYSNTNEINHKERLMWLKNITNEMPNIEVHEILDNSSIKSEHNWEHGKKIVLDIIKEPINIVFCGGDYKESNIFGNLYKTSEIHYFDRKSIPISSTMIRKSPFKYYKYLPNIVKEYYVKKVVVVGTESSGKSTLVRNLAKSYNTTYVAELGREICDSAGGIDNMQNKHYEKILYKHKDKEQSELVKANKVLFIDTEALVTLYYYKLQFQNTKYYDKKIVELATSISKLNKYDLYLFLEPDVAWVQDGTRTYGEDKIRKENNETLKKILKSANINYISINGNYQARYKKSKQLVDKLLNNDQFN